jgi:hypothetical protein
MPCCVSDGGDCHDWTCIGQELTYESYSVLAISLSRDKLAIGSLDGKIKVISIGLKDEVKEWQAYDGKVFSLIWSNDDTLFSTGPDGVVICWSTMSNLKENIPLALFRCILPPCKHCWVTALTMVKVTIRVSETLVLVCGDRSGSVHLYCVSMAGLHDYTPLKSFPGLHGKHGVSHICSNGSHVYSVGRNGVFAQYVFSDDQLNIVDKNPIKGMEWIEQMFFTDGQGLLLSGFHSIDFVLMNWKTGEIVLKCYCGGAHRAWDFYVDGELSVAVFAYLKGKQLHMVQKQLQKIAKPLLQVLMQHFQLKFTLIACILSNLICFVSKHNALSDQIGNVSIQSQSNKKRFVKSNSFTGTCSHFNVFSHFRCVNSGADPFTLAYET